MNEYKHEATEYLNILRLLSTIAVVILHVITNPSIININYYTDSELFIMKLLLNFFVWCVPVFCMISGIIFLNPEKEISITIMFKKYIFRILTALLIFGSLFSLMEIVFVERHFAISQLFLSFYNVIVSKSWDHLWYLYMIIGLYTIVPILKLLTTNANDTIFYYTIFIMFIFTSIIPTFEKISSISLGWKLPLISVYITYFLLGYGLQYRNLLLKKKAAITIIISFVFLESLLSFLPSLSSSESLYIKGFGYDSPFVALLAWSIFSLFKEKKAKSRIANYLNPFCFGIYLIHPVIINLINKVFHFTLPTYNLWISFFTTLIISILFSFAFTFILKKCPFIKKIM